MDRTTRKSLVDLQKIKQAEKINRNIRKSMSKFLGVTWLGEPENWPRGEFIVTSLFTFGSP